MGLLQNNSLFYMYNITLFKLPSPQKTGQDCWIQILYVRRIRMAEMHKANKQYYNHSIIEEYFIHF